MTNRCHAHCIAFLRKIDAGDIAADDAVSLMIGISKTAQETMGGTSGALYSCVISNEIEQCHRNSYPNRIFFSALAQGIQVSARDSEITSEGWGQALVTARDKLYTYTRARPPSRTLVDPLAAFIETYKDTQGNYFASVKAAAEAAEATTDVDAKAGRSAYVENARLKMERIPDPGAWGVKIILENLG